jgi:hypothetical protein
VTAPDGGDADAAYGMSWDYEVATRQDSTYTE